MRILIFSLATFLFSSQVFAQQANQSLNAAIELFQNGQYRKAEDILVQKINSDKFDTDSRLMLGMMANYLGDKKRAISIWEEGLNGDYIEYPLLLSIGELYIEEAVNAFPVTLFQASDFAALNLTPEYFDTQLKYCVKSINVYKRAAKLYPYEPEPLEKMAFLYDLSKKYDSALIFWQQLIDMHPDNEKYLVGKANSLYLRGDFKAATKIYHAAMLLKKNYAPAYLGLSECYRASNQDFEADIYGKKAEFYTLCPSFLEMSYSTEFSDLLDSLFLFNNMEKNTFEPEKILKRYDAQSAEIAAYILNCRIFSGTAAEALMINFLASHSKKGVWYLMQLTEKSEDPVFIYLALKKIADEKPPGLFDYLNNLLKENLSLYGSPVLETMQFIDDFRVEGVLIREMQKSNDYIKSKPESNNQGIQYMLIDESLRNIRIQAILSLSKFKSEMTIKYLKKGLEDEEIAHYCSAALFRITSETKYLEKIKKMVQNEEQDIIMGEFLMNSTCKKVKKLAKKLMSL